MVLTYNFIIYHPTITPDIAPIEITAQGGLNIPIKSEGNANIKVIAKNIKVNIIEYKAANLNT